MVILNLIFMGSVLIFLWIIVLPVFSLIFPGKTLVYRNDIAKKNIKFSAVIVVIAGFYLLNFSFSIGSLDKIAGIIVLLMLLKLSVSAFHLNQKIIGVAIGTSSLILVSIFVIISYVLSGFQSHEKHDFKELPASNSINSIYCMKYSNDFGEGIHVFKRYVIIDKRLIPKSLFSHHYNQLSREDELLMESCYEVF